MALLASRGELGAHRREDSLLGVDEALQAEWIAHRTSCRQGPSTLAAGGSMSDPFSLQRFVDAQEGVFAAVRAELAAGRKQSHWMWFVFPQLKGLGSRATARHYAIGSL